jgi:hypothetical protein
MKDRAVAVIENAIVHSSDLPAIFFEAIPRVRRKHSNFLHTNLTNFMGMIPY